MKLRPAHLRRPLAPSLLVLVLAAACAGGGGSPSPSPVSTASPVPTASSASSGGPVDSVDEAAQRVLALDPRFEDLEPFDPELIGGCCFYEAREVDGGYEVDVEIGWGDCPAGCINRHRWVYAVARSGEVRLIEETGPSLEPGIFPGDS